MAFRPSSARSLDGQRPRLSVWSLPPAIVLTSLSPVPFGIFTLLFLGVTTYVSLDIGLGVTQLIGGVESPPEALRNIPLFV
ncbi:hypothetical protein D9611_014603 [Ephemerocybe angulata]|uniref:Uncharacterized protein n=1 Tax=Ephemerocybe angulata TaxID=980116 RepID=A0A8H5CBS0_9AGAR|nr:hypothetical protein D9611_014603 [Tulosesus angulatus]